jgi:SAM-dependent methyltransferase
VPGPIPPDDLIVRVGVLPAAFPTPEARVQIFTDVGRAGYDDICSALPDDWSWDGKRILDFGCGSGRLLRWFADHDAELVGCDIHEPTIAWMRQAYPDARVYVNGTDPPLDEPDGSIDLIYCSSVFSHIPDWAPWLLEMRRLLRHDGLLVASLHGPGFWPFGVAGSRGEPWDEDATGMLIEHAGSGFEDTCGPAVYVSEWWLRSHWGRALTIDRFHSSGFSLPSNRTSGQAWVVARRDDRAAPTIEQLLAPEYDRELPAALRALRLAYEEVAAQSQQLHKFWRQSLEAADVRDELRQAREREASLQAELARPPSRRRWFAGGTARG